MAYPLHDSAFGIPASPTLPDLEREILAYWDADDTFQASVDRNPAGENGSNEFVFYDGPPFANGLPHYGHLLTGYAKDVVPRFETMRGRRVERRFGWDTHGLPAELDAMRTLGIKTKEEIVDIGVEAFNAACRQSVLKYAGEWQDYVTRQARWVDFGNDYKTMDLPYMESVMWGFKQLWDKGLIYEGFRVLPYCWNDQTPLSNHELRMDDEVYQDRSDPSVTVGLRVVESGSADSAESPGSAESPVQPGDLLVIWTTTPWTLPSNLLVAAGPSIEYAIVESSKPTGAPERYVLAKDLLSAYSRELLDESTPTIEDQIVGTLTGADLAGTTYAPPFTYYQGHPHAHQVVTADFVTTTDGTGLVHIAPAFGEDDKIVSDAHGVDTVIPVGSDGCFEFPVTDYQGLQVFDANAIIVEHLKARTYLDATPGAEADTASVTAGTILIRRAQYTHSYPHCYRCKKPLIYMGVSSWFVKVTAIKERMLELNEEINWTPGHIQHGIFGKWLENARDWSITRNRFWGSPVPVWKSDNPAYPRVDVYGSLAELEADFGVAVTDLHRPFIDELTRPNPDDPSGASTMRRVEDILDVWMDSGAMPYAQVHYPFENTEWFEHHYPGDFIVEYIGQTRGWFYTLHILATAIMDRPAFKNCVSHGIVLGDDGRKMSKSLRNYPDVNEVFDRDGSDAMRWFLMASPILRGGNLIVTEQGIRDSVRQVLLPLWSTYYFYCLYANAARTQSGACSGPAEGQAGVDERSEEHANAASTSPAVEPASEVSGGRNPGSPASTGYLATPLTEDRIASLPALDRYIVAKTHDLQVTVTEQLDAFDIAGACESVRVFLDVLTNWYVRTQRDRFWSEDADAFDTLYTVLETLCRVMAPLAPLLTEEVWRGLTGQRSVHLVDWPEPVAAWSDAALVESMDEVRAVVSTALGLRKANKLRVRQPLAALTVAVENSSALTDYVPLLTSELNVKAVELLELSDSTAAQFGIVQRLAVNARAAGPRLGRGVQAVIKASKAGQWGMDGDVVVVHTPDDDIALLDGEYELTTVVEPGAGAGASAGAAAGAVAERAAAVLPGGGFAVLNTTLTPELEAEGYARDVIRDVQDARKAAGLEVADRINLTVGVPLDRVADVKAHAALIQEETLAVEMTVAAAEGSERTVTVAKANVTSV